MLVVHLLIFLSHLPTCDLAGQSPGLFPWGGGGGGSQLTLDKRSLGVNGVVYDTECSVSTGLEQPMGRYDSSFMFNVHLTGYSWIVKVWGGRCGWYSSLPCMGKPLMVVVTVQGAPMVGLLHLTFSIDFVCHVSCNSATRRPFLPFTLGSKIGIQSRYRTLPIGHPARPWQFSFQFPSVPLLSPSFPFTWRAIIYSASSAWGYQTFA